MHILPAYIEAVGNDDKAAAVAAANTPPVERIAVAVAAADWATAKPGEAAVKDGKVAEEFVVGAGVAVEVDIEI